MNAVQYIAYSLFKMDGIDTVAKRANCFIHKFTPTKIGYPPNGRHPIVRFQEVIKSEKSTILI